MKDTGIGGPRLTLMQRSCLKSAECNNVIVARLNYCPVYSFSQAMETARKISQRRGHLSITGGRGCDRQRVLAEPEGRFQSQGLAELRSGYHSNYSANETASKPHWHLQEIFATLLQFAETLFGRRNTEFEVIL